MATIENYNYLPDNTFELRIIELPNVSFYAQDVALPSVAIPEVDAFFPGNPLRLQGDSIQFSPLDVTFIVDERMNNYIEVYKWVEGQRYGSKNSEQYGQLVSEAFLLVNSANSTYNRIVKFKGLFPVNLSQLNFRTTDSDVQYLTCTVSFAFTEFDIE